MTTRNGWTGAGVLALALVPALSFADSDHTQAQRPSTAQAEQRGSVYRTDERFTRTVAGECRYTGTLQGTVREVSSQTGTLYSPDLTLDGVVQCPGGYNQSIGTQRITAPRLTRDEVKRSVEAKGRVTIQHGGRICTITPDFDFREGRVVAGQSFSQSCRLAQGGGP